MKKNFLIAFFIIMFLNTKAALANNHEIPLVYREYAQNVEKTVKGNWNPPADNKTMLRVMNSENAEVSLTLRIDSDGRIVSTRVSDSNNDKAMIESVLIALANSVPLEPLPSVAEKQKEYIDVSFTFAFDYSYEQPGPLTRILEEDEYNKVYNSFEDESLKNDYLEYLRVVQSSLRSLTFKKMPPAKTKLQFEIAQGGKMQNLIVLAASNNPKFDEAAIKAIKSLSFPNPPEHLNIGTVTIQCVVANIKGSAAVGRI